MVCRRELRARPGWGALINRSPAIYGPELAYVKKGVESPRLAVGGDQGACPRKVPALGLARWPLCLKNPLSRRSAPDHELRCPRREEAARVSRRLTNSWSYLANSVISPSV